MTAAERRRPWLWPVAVGAAHARGARAAAVGLPPRPAVRLQRRRERALRGRRDRHVRAHLQPDYFINPPAFTYLLHAAFALGFGGRDGVSATPTRPTRPTSFALARALSARARRGRGRAAGVGRRAAVRPPRRLRRRRAAGGRVPARPLQPLRAQRRADARAAVPRAGRRRRRLRARADARLRARRRRRSGWPARRSTPAGSCCCRCWRPPRSARTRRSARRIGGLALAARLALAAFLVANPFALLDFGSFRDGLNEQSAASSDGGGKLGLTAEQRDRLLPRDADLGPRLAAGAGGGRRRGRCWRCATGGARSCWCPPLVAVPRSSWARRTASSPAGCCRLPAPVPARRLRRAAAARARWLRRPALGAAARGRRRAAVRAGPRVRDPQRPSCSPATTRAQLARDWMVENVPAGTKVVIEPVAPDSWASDPGRALRGATGNGARWAKWPTSRSRIKPDGTPRKGGLGPIVKLEDYERTLFPQLVGSVRRPRLLHGADRLDPVRPRAGRARGRPAGDPLLRRAAAQRAASCSPSASRSRTFSFDFSFNSYPLAFDRPGPEIVIYRLHGWGTAAPVKYPACAT